MDTITESLTAVKDKVTSVASSAKDAVSAATEEHLIKDTGSINTGIIISLVLIMIVIYIAMYYHRQSKFSPYLLLDITPTGKTNEPKTIVQANKIPDTKNSSQYSYSFWIYVSSDALANSNQNSTNSDKYRVIFGRKDDNHNEYRSIYAIDTKHKKLLIRHALHGNSNSNNLLDGSESNNFVSCDVENFPYDRFVHVAVIKYGYTLVVYINGILVKSKTTTKKFMTLNTSDTLVNHYKNEYYVVPGWYSKIRYFVDFNKETGGALNDKQVYDLYLNSPYPSLLEKLINAIFGKIIRFTDDDNRESKYDAYKKQLNTSFPDLSGGSGDEMTMIKAIYDKLDKESKDTDQLKQKINAFCKTRGTGCSPN